MTHISIEKSPLSKRSEYPTHYSPGVLYPIARKINRAEFLEQPKILPFQGYDLWNAYEVSWLQPSGLPKAAIARFIIPANSPNIIESKSFKLYLNSLNNSKFKDEEELKSILEKDISAALDAPSQVALIDLNSNTLQGQISGKCLDTIVTDCQYYQPNAKLLITKDTHTCERLYTHLFRSNCPVTYQPDWATVIIDYEGNAIDHSNLLRYLVSYRNHAQFHEHCIEMIFTDIMAYCQPNTLCVEAKFTRRGGMDINPIRANYPVTNCMLNTIRQ